MNDNGKIAQFADPKLARAAGFHMPLTKAEADKLTTIPESERVAEHVANRHAAFDKGPIPRGKGSTFCPSPRDRAKKRRRVSR